MQSPMRSLRQSDGFILIVVIWVAALLALVAAAFVRSAQSHVRATAISIQTMRAELLADSVLSLVALDLISRRLDASKRRFPVDGTLVRCSFDGGRVVVVLQDAGGRVNLNTANDELLRALFVGLGASKAQASSYADAIIDFRDRDDLRRPSGAEKPEYLAAGRPLGPKNAAFDNLDELHQVLGLDPDIIAAMIPYVTIHSGTAGLDLEVISPVLSDLLARGAGGPSGLSSAVIGERVLPTEFIVSSTRRVFLAKITARTASATTFVRETVIELPQARIGLPIYRVWKRGFEPDSFDDETDFLPPPC